MNHKDEKRDAAKVLYMEGIAQDNICKILGVAPNTIVRWKQQDNWTERRISKNLAEETTQELARELLNYELTIARHFIDGQMALPIAERKAIDNAVADKIVKFYKPLIKQEIKYETYIKIIKQLLAYTSETDLDVAQKLTPITNRFLNDIRKTLV